MISPINSNINFMGLPRYLQRENIDVLTARGLTDIIKDAGQQAGIVIKTNPKQVFKNNAKLFNGIGQITREGVDMLTEEYSLTNGKCTELRDALAKDYRAYYKTHDGILDQII